MYKYNNYRQKLLLNISNSIRSLREEFDYKQKDVAKKLNVPSSTYYNWENAENFPPLKKLDDLSLLYNVSLDYIFGRTNNKQIDKNIRPLSKTKITENCVKYRKYNKYTIEYVSTYCGIAVSNYFNIEKGNRPMKAYNLSKLLDLYNESADIFTGKK